MEQIIPLSEESQYNEILRQAVAVIESSRSKAARAIVATSNEMHWAAPMNSLHCLCA